MKRFLFALVRKELNYLPTTSTELALLIEEVANRSQGKVIDFSVVPMLKSLLRFSELTARQVMVPQSTMKVVNKESDLDEIIEVMSSSGHSRFPVIGKSRDNVEGIVLAKEIFCFASHFKKEKERFVWNDFIRTPQFVPESRSINVLLNDFKRTHNHMVLVVNEYGSVSGLVTIEDVLEEIVGEIVDESEREIVEQIIQLDKHHYLIHPHTTLSTLQKQLQIDLQSDTQDTIAGYIFEKLGRLAKKKDVVSFDTGEFEIVKANKRGIEKIRLTLFDSDH
ncbi:MAG: hemolysin family protein [Methylacidiphilales bacterium]|nr:hemolysin family protein [Candidatus Methylacidiphilales bacterium]